MYLDNYSTVTTLGVARVSAQAAGVRLFFAVINSGVRAESGWLVCRIELAVDVGRMYSRDVGEVSPG